MYFFAQEAATTPDFLNRMDDDLLFPLVMVALLGAIGLMFGLSAMVITAWKNVRERQIWSQTVQQMLANQMSVEEISEIMSLWQNSSCGSLKGVKEAFQRGPAPIKPPKQFSNI